MFASASLLISLAILFFVIRFRIHVHVVYQGSPWVASPRRKQAGVKACSSSTRALLPLEAPNRATAMKLGEIQGNGQVRRGHPYSQRNEHVAPECSDLQSALVNLGASKSRARTTAQKVCQQHPGADFDQLVRIAIQEVQAA